MPSGYSTDAFINNVQQPQSQSGMSQALLSQQPQQPVPNAPSILDVSGSGPGSVSSITPDQANTITNKQGNLIKMAVQEDGFGSLAAGLHALFLSPKVKEAQAEAAKTQLLQTNLELDAKKNANLIDQQNIKAKQKQLDDMAGLDSLSRLEGKTSDDIQGDALKAKAEFTQDGRVKTNYDKLAELQKQGKIPYNIQSLAAHSPGLVLKLGQTYSQYTSDAFMKELDDAAKEQRLYNTSIADMFRAKKELGNKTEDDKRNNFRAYSTMLNSLGNTLRQANDPTFKAANPQAYANIMTQTVIPGFASAARFAKENGIVEGDQYLDPNEFIQAEAEAEAGNPERLNKFVGSFQANQQAAAKYSEKPPTSPDNVKTKAPPPPVASSGGDKTKKEAKQGLAGLLD